MTERKRPFGVTMLSLFYIVVGIFGMATGIEVALLELGGELTLVANLQLVALVIGVLTLMAGIGLWDLKSWAWSFAALMAVIGLVLNILAVIVDFALFTFYLLPLMIRLLLLIYLFSDDIKSKFR
jgi:uncharacterized membrane protein (DUF2068 family)